jgi:type III pantothenate kinase
VNLVVDLGNTRAKIALFEGRSILEQWVFDAKFTVAELQKIYRTHSGIKNTIVSSVLNHSKDVVNFLSNHSQYIPFDNRTPLPIINSYKTPESLGKDRLAAVVGAWSLHKGNTVLVIDAGTCIKLDLITSKNEYLGGSISPGINMRFKALNYYTDKLPIVDVDKNYHSLTGVSTKESLLSGVQVGVLFEVQGFINEYSKQYPDLKIVLTGGDKPFFELGLKNHIFAIPELVLLGLNEILLFNAKL